MEVETYARPFQEKVIVSKPPPTVTLARIALACLTLLAVSSLGEWYFTWESLKAARSVSLTTTLPTVVALIEENNGTLSVLKSAPFSEPGNGVLASYLAAIRRDGVEKHAEMKQRLDTVDANNLKALALFEAYLPHAKTPALLAEGKQFQTFVITWHERWIGVFETFMAGGNTPTADAASPALLPALRAEILTTQ